MNKQCRTSQ
jgi:hypothetical protein